MNIQPVSEAGGSGASSDLEFPAWPRYRAEEIEAASEILRSGRVNYWTGDEGRNFEREFSAYIGTEHAVAVSNGSAALGVALRALQLTPGAEVVVTPRTFVATVSEILLAGLRPVFADVDPDSQNLTSETIAAVLSERTEAVLVVHLAGWPCEMESIVSLAELHGLAVIEDCAQAHGAAINGQKVGSWGDIAAFSFCQDKIMTTGGEGGMIVTNNGGLAEFCWSFKDHGKCESLMTAPSDGSGFRWVHQSIGTNLRMTEIQSAIGRLQLRNLDESVSRRQQNAAVLYEQLADVQGIRFPWPGGNIQHAFYKCYLFIEPEHCRPGWSRDSIAARLTQQGIPCGSGICPEVYLESAIAGLEVAPATRLPTAKCLGETSLMFRVDPSLDDSHMQATAMVLKKLMSQACG